MSWGLWGIGVPGPGERTAIMANCPDDEYMTGQCAAWAISHQREHPHLRLGIDWQRLTPDHPDWDEEDDGDEAWQPQHIFTHDDHYAYDVRGAHPLSKIRQWDDVTLNHSPEDVMATGMYEGGYEPEPEMVRRVPPRTAHRTAMLPPRTYVKEVDPFDWSDEADRGAALFHEDHDEPLSGLAWRNGGEVAMIATPDEHQRKGYARELFNHVRQHIDPSLHHSDSLTEDGAAWRSYMESLDTAHRTAMPTYYHRSPTYLQEHRPDRAMPHTYFYTADDPHDVDWETRAYGDQVYAADLPAEVMEPDPAPRRAQDSAVRWWRTDPANVGEMTHLHDPTAPFGVPNKKARIMSAAVTVYTQPNCIQCTMTKKQLDKLGIAHDTVDVSADPEAHAYVRGLGYTAAPVVVVNDGEEHWAGFKPDRLKGLAE